MFAGEGQDFVDLGLRFGQDAARVGMVGEEFADNVSKLGGRVDARTRFAQDLGQAVAFTVASPANRPTSTSDASTVPIRAARLVAPSAASGEPLSAAS